MNFTDNHLMLYWIKRSEALASQGFGSVIESIYVKTADVQDIRTNTVYPTGVIMPGEGLEAACFLCGGEDAGRCGTGPTHKGGPQPYMPGEVDFFEDPNTTNNMTDEEEQAFRIRKTWYSHICEVAKMFRWMSHLYEKRKAANTWVKNVPPKKKQKGHGNTASKDKGNGGGDALHARPSSAPTPAPAPGQAAHSSAGQSCGQGIAAQDVDFFKPKIRGLELQMVTMLKKMDQLQQSVDTILAQL
ncbi:uncharacterized protein LOC144823786 [Lissotriton helveticus]